MDGPKQTSTWMNKVFRYGLIFLLLTANISCDQISKSIVRQKMFHQEQINVIHDYFTLIKVENTGAFLSLGTEIPEPFKSILLAFLPLVFLTIAAIYVVTKKSLSLSRVIAISFVIGGGAGNIYDRLVHGSVTDFLHIDLGIVRTGIFNMADVSIMIGMVMLLIESFIVQNPQVFAESKKNENLGQPNG
jgi:signal peptidase II